MPMIFDSFPDRGSAERFAALATNRHRLLAAVYDDADEANDVDPFPFELTPPVVHVARSRSQRAEQELESVVASYGGRFAGT